jgi:hypothetical protein
MLLEAYDLLMNTPQVVQSVEMYHVPEAKPEELISSSVVPV